MKPAARALSAAACSLLLLGPLPAQAHGTPTRTELVRSFARRLVDPGQHGDAASELFGRRADRVPILVALLRADQPWPEGQAGAGQDAVVELLWQLGPDAADALDAMIDSLPEMRPSTRERMLEAIGRCAPYLPERRQAVEQRLGNECDAGKYFGAGGFFETISRLQFAADGSLEDLLAGLGHDNVYIRQLAAEAIARRLDAAPPDGPQRALVLRTLLEAQQADLPRNFKVSWTYNGSQAGTSGGTVRPERARAAISSAIAVIAPERVEALDGLLLQLRSPEPQRCAEAARNIGGLGAGADKAVPVLIGLLGKGGAAAHEAATALGMLGAATAKAAIPALEAAADSPDRQLAARAKAALRRLQQ